MHAKASGQELRERINLLSARKKNKLLFPVAGLTISIATFTVLFFIYILGEQNFSYIEIGVGITISILLGTVCGFLLFVKNCSELDNLEWRDTMNAIKEKSGIIGQINEQSVQNTNQGNDERRQLGEDFLTNLFQINHKYSNAYNELTRKQADKSFWLAVFSSVIGVLLIMLGVVLMFFKEVTPTYVATVGGVLTEFISALFLYFHTSTIKNMSKYHNKLLLSQNISIALKITETLPLEIQNSTREKLVEQLASDINKYISLEGE